MKKDRNSFFSNYTSQYQSYTPNMGMPNSFNDNYYPNDLGFQNDIENRLSKIERQLNRLEQRIGTLENKLSTPHSSDQNYQNMYMI